MIVLRRRVLLHRKAKRKKKVLPWQVVAQNLLQPNPIEGNRTRGGLIASALERQRDGIASHEEVPAVGTCQHVAELQLGFLQRGVVRLAQTEHVCPKWLEE